MREKIEKELNKMKKTLRAGRDVVIKLIDITEDNTVKLELKSNSPMSIVSIIEDSIEKTLEKKIPEIREVVFI